MSPHAPEPAVPPPQCSSAFLHHQLKIRSGNPPSPTQHNECFLEEEEGLIFCLDIRHYSVAFIVFVLFLIS